MTDGSSASHRDARVVARLEQTQFMLQAERTPSTEILPHEAIAIQRETEIGACGDRLQSMRSQDRRIKAGG